jgi:aminopeptidase N
VAVQQAAGSDPYFPDHGDARYRVHRYELALDYRPAPNRLAASARINAIAGRSPLAEFMLNLSDFKIGRVRVDGRQAHYTHRGGRLRVRPAKPVRPGAAFTVEVHWSGNPKPVNSPWGGLGWEELEDGALVASQPVGAPSWYPCNDRPADKASYQISVTTPSAYAVVAGGRLLTRTTKASTTTWVYEQAAPTSSYLVGLAIGKYQTVLLGDPGPGGVPQHGHIPAHLLPEFSRDFARQPQMMDLFQELFGPYPFDEYGAIVVPEPTGLALETQTRSTFGNDVGDIELFRAHELAHQWFGDDVTPERWEDIWLNEGFASYAEMLWFEASRDDYDIDQDAEARRNTIDDGGQILDPGIDRWFGDAVYQRGGLALHALRRTVGDDDFFEILQTWTSEKGGGNATTDDFIALAEDVSGQDLGQFFEDWLVGEGVPELP